MISARKGADPWGGDALGVFLVHGRGLCPRALAPQWRQTPALSRSLLPSRSAVWLGNSASGPFVAPPTFGRAHFEAGGPRQGVAGARPSCCAEARQMLLRQKERTHVALFTLSRSRDLHFCR